MNDMDATTAYTSAEKVRRFSRAWSILHTRPANHNNFHAFQHTLTAQIDGQGHAAYGAAAETVPHEVSSPNRRPMSLLMKTVGKFKKSPSVYDLCAGLHTHPLTGDRLEQIHALLRRKGTVSAKVRRLAWSVTVDHRLVNRTGVYSSVFARNC